MGYKLTQQFSYLDLLTVDKKFSNQKIGKYLLDVFRKELKQQHLKQYFLIAPTFNKQTINFYRKNGLIEGVDYTLFCDDL